MSLITIRDLTFGYDGSYDTIFDHVSLQLDTNWKLGFTGRNGRGKTTFLRLLMGEMEYRGSIHASVHFDYFPFPVKDTSAKVLALLKELCPNAMEWELCKELSLLQVDEDVLCRPFSTLSSGEQTKVLLAGLFLKENNFLLIDEPTNHLDLEARALLSRYFNRKHGFLLISHDRAFLDGCIDHIVSINKTNIDVQKGNFSSWQRNKEWQDQFEQAEDERLRKDIALLSSAKKQTSGWSRETEQSKYQTRNSGLRPDHGYIGHKAAKMMKRAKTLEARQNKAMEEKGKLLKNLETAEELKLRPLEYQKNTLLELSGISIRYGEKTAAQNISFTVKRGERVVLRGRNGSGKSSILKLIRGEPMEHTGLLSIGSGLRLSYLPQDSSFLRGDLKTFAQEEGMDESLFKAILRKLDFSKEQFDKDMSDFSGGQKKKTLLARSLCQSAHLYLWDEPLNFVDVLSRIQIEKLLLEYQPTLLFVEHDAAFCSAIATKEVWL